jgi:hypothetical protein
MAFHNRLSQQHERLLSEPFSSGKLFINKTPVVHFPLGGAKRPCSNFRLMLVPMKAHSAHYSLTLFYIMGFLHYQSRLSIKGRFSLVDGIEQDHV